MYKFAAASHVGNIRENNEDSYTCDSQHHLWIVADGMGGLGFGEVASAISTYTIQSQVKAGHGINQAIELAHRRIKEYVQSEASGTDMGTTIVLLFCQGSLYNVFWAGDSRAYLFDDGLNQLTVDHSLVQSLIDQGELTEADAITDPRKNAVTRALGVQEIDRVRAACLSGKWQKGQKILLCSDGLSDWVSDQEIERTLRSNNLDQARVDSLISLALDKGGKDNITAILIDAPEFSPPIIGDTRVPSVSMPPKYPSADRHNPGTEPKPPIPENKSYTKNKSSASNNADKNRQDAAYYFSWKRLQIAVALILASIIFAQMSTTKTHTPTPTAFTQIEIRKPEPEGRVMLPSIDLGARLDARPLPQTGPVLQTGLFSRLAGAETQQHELSKMGLLPVIEKTLRDSTVHYAVLLGPFGDPAALRSTKKKLSNAKFNYYLIPTDVY